MTVLFAVGSIGCIFDEDRFLRYLWLHGSGCCNDSVQRG